MQAATILVLACAGAANAQNIRPLYVRSDSHDDFWPIPPAKQSYSDWINDPSLKKIPNSFEHLNQNPSNSFPSKPKSPWMNEPTSSEEENDPQDSDASNEQSLQNPSQAWSPPPYYQSLKDYDDAVELLKNHFTLDAFTDKNNKNFRFIVIAHVIDQLSKSVAEKGWTPYEKNYTRLIQNYIKQAAIDPRGVVSQLMCSMFDPATRKIQRVKNIIRNPAVEFVCKAQPSACDTVIFGIVKSNNNFELEHSADVLLSLGRASSSFLKNYAPAFDAISTQNVYLFLLKSADFLRGLIGKNAETRKLIFPTGSRSCFQ